MVALNGDLDIIAEDLLDISKENEIENAAVSEAAAASDYIMSRPNNVRNGSYCDIKAAALGYTTSLFPKITQV